jgi:hypothetical protein
MWGLPRPCSLFRCQMKTVEDFISAQTPDRRKLLQHVRTLFLASAPAVTEKISYGIPFFSRFTWLGYLNPTREGLDVGFTRGHLLSGSHERLEVRDRKIVRSILLRWDETRDETDRLLMPVIREALLVDEWNHGRQKKAKKK